MYAYLSSVISIVSRCIILPPYTQPQLHCRLLAHRCGLLMYAGITNRNKFWVSKINVKDFV